MPDLSRYLDRVTCGDCLDVLRELPDCSVELCATDPPFGIAFMSKTWDSDIPARAIWAEVLRVLKPGASCFVCAGSRQDTILGLLTDLREVGFDIQHAALTWTYATGFPKSTDVGKDIDKAAFLAWLREVPPGETETRQALMGWDAADVRKAASAAVNGAYSTQEVSEGRQRQCKHGPNEVTRPWEAESGTGTGTLLLAALQARFGDAPGVRLATGTVHKSVASMAPGEGCFSDDAYEWQPEFNRSAPATPEAVQWDGWRSSSVPLKPSSEQILWVTKPAEPGPARANVLKWGTGAVNVEECRVPTPEGVTCERPVKKRQDYFPHGYRAIDDHPDGYVTGSASGRYPSNLLVSARALGDDSRYGDLDAWAREHGISDEWLDAALSAGVLRVPKPSRSEKNAGCEGLEERPEPWEHKQWVAGGQNKGATCKPRSNNHPTTKPVTLMAFLCTLACPRAGVVLDPFLGSGTTAIAAVQTGMHFIGIEREPEYVAIAEARIAAAFRDRQPTLALDAAE